MPKHRLVLSNKPAVTYRFLANGKQKRNFVNHKKSLQGHKLSCRLFSFETPSLTIIAPTWGSPFADGR